MNGEVLIIDIPVFVEEKCILCKGILPPHDPSNGKKKFVTCGNCRLSKIKVDISPIVDHTKQQRCLTCLGTKDISEFKYKSKPVKNCESCRLYYRTIHKNRIKNINELESAKEENKTQEIEFERRKQEAENKKKTKKENQEQYKKLKHDIIVKYENLLIEYKNKAKIDKALEINALRSKMNIKTDKENNE